ncbi:hypothetical protein Salmuc_03990 [Salipiger mucosus DSM 16094]|uniref:Uncharacterized protein n=2 Tax=Salipiger mucosus TaxID=263378 RepID=S9RWI4_9RHOB|nr:hypothetical protein Salmuc_03990 [Salipiger mucosus DSM 16094]
MVEELYPDQFTWKQPESERPLFHYSSDEDGPGYHLNHRGIVECETCATSRKATIRWPEAAYWQWEVSGHPLVARNRAHAEQILDFLRERNRSPNRRPSLRRIPTQLLTKRLAPEVRRRVGRDLELA